LTDAGELVLDPVEESTLVVNGDTGISGGPIDQAMNSIIGESRVMMLFNNAVKNGNTVDYTLTEFVGIRVLYANLTTSNKVIWVQMATVVDGTAITDYDEEIGENTTVFTPLILIQ
jgi:hypothetical protein